MKKIFLILIAAASIITAQDKDPYKILDGVKEKFGQIKDYSVDASIKVDVNFLRVPETHATIYFKQPDKVRLKSEGFALLPKEGLNFSPTKLLNDDYNALYIKSEELNGHIVDVVKVIPNNDSLDVILSSLWIDSKKNIVRKIETTTKRSGTLTIELEYENNSKWGLPSQVTFSFNVSDLQIPATLSGEFNDQDESQPKKKKKKNEPMTGTVTVQYENYKVNLGIEESIFDDDKKEKTKN